MLRRLSCIQGAGGPFPRLNPQQLRFHSRLLGGTSARQWLVAMLLVTGFLYAPGAHERADPIFTPLWMDNGDLTGDERRVVPSSP